MRGSIALDLSPLRTLVCAAVIPALENGLVEAKPDPFLFGMPAKDLMHRVLWLVFGDWSPFPLRIVPTSAGVFPALASAFVIVEKLAHSAASFTGLEDGAGGLGRGMKCVALWTTVPPEME